MGWTSSCFAQRPAPRNVRLAGGCLRVALAMAATKEGRRIRGEISPDEISLLALALRDCGVWPRSRGRQRAAVSSRRFARLRLPLARAEAWPASAGAYRRFRQETASLARTAQTFRCASQRRR